MYELKPWQSHGFAIVVTVITLGLRLAFDETFEGRPTLMIFVLPIMLSAYVGGLRAGLLATALAYFAASYYLLPPLNSFAVASTVKRWQLFFLVLTGGLISVLNALHQARRRAALSIREHLQAKTALDKAEVLQAAIFNSAYFSIIATDEKGVIQIFNVGAERLLGYAAAEVVNKITSADLHDPQEVTDRATALSLEYGRPIAPRFEALVFKAALGGEDIYEVTKVRKDGSRFPAQLSVTVLRNAEDGIIGYLLIATDNTARKMAEEEWRRAEKEIQSLNAVLEQRVLERTMQLKSANDEMEAFSYSVSHDLRAPLRHVAGFVQLLQQDAGPTLSEKGLRHLSTISQSAQRMGILIDDLLSFSRIGKSELRKVEVNLDDLVREAIGDFQAETSERNTEWDIGPLPVVWADRSLLRLVLVNLMSNAVKFTSARAKAKIEIGSTSNPNGDSVIFIRDNGAGFDPRYADKLFGVFQRLHSREEFEGTGIGLANVQRIIHRHGGRAWAEGVVDGGATFSFLIPKQPTEV